MKLTYALAASLLLTACSGDAPEAPIVAPADDNAPRALLDKAATSVKALQMYRLDCGLIEISDLDDFSTAGDYAGLSATFTDTCWLLRHPKGNVLWDLGLPTGLVGNGEQKNGVFTLSMDRTLSDQLAEIGLFASDIDMLSISHSHFDHAGQADQFPKAKWLVHADEFAAMFPAETDTQTGAADDDSNEESDAGSLNPFLDFASLERQEFTGEYDVFGDGSVIIIPTPGHTPGHTSLLVTLPETGPVLLTGDLYHRRQSRTLKRVPRFNTDEAATRASMEMIEARVSALGARLIIQHEIEDMADLPLAPAPIR